MEMGATTDDRLRETWDRLVLLLIARPREGWELEFGKITRRELERLAPPTTNRNFDRDAGE